MAATASPAPTWSASRCRRSSPSVHASTRPRGRPGPCSAPARLRTTRSSPRSPRRPRRAGRPSGSSASPSPPAPGTRRGTRRRTRRGILSSRTLRGTLRSPCRSIARAPVEIACGMHPQPRPSKFPPRARKSRAPATAPRARGTPRASSGRASPPSAARAPCSSRTARQTSRALGRLTEGTTLANPWQTGRRPPNSQPCHSKPRY
mmetsp:Transcript_1162/g.3585  ORF Transcript_1162/g.3585 Transcript_1162/m.3585 type:complete len:205 (-) Transcript_1162:175-789(-)